MNTDKFYTAETTDKMSKILMPVLTGVILGAVIIRAHYDVFNPIIDSSLGLTALYCVCYTFYMFFKSAKNSSTSICLFKDYLSVVIAKKGGEKTRTDIAYSDISAYKIMPRVNLNNLISINSESNKLLANPIIAKIWVILHKICFNKFLLRPYGFKTIIELKDGQVFEFSDSKTDGVLIYSPGYVYRMLDLKRYKTDFPLELLEFDSKKDIEGFKEQFDYYDKEGKSLKLWKNKRYLASLLLYTALFGLFSFLIASVVAYTIWSHAGNESLAKLELTYTLETFAAIVIPMWYLALTVNIFGAERNKRAQSEIKNIILPE